MKQLLKDWEREDRERLAEAQLACRRYEEKLAELARIVPRADGICAAVAALPEPDVAFWMVALQERFAAATAAMGRHGNENEYAVIYRQVYAETMALSRRR
jgi:hypothetical protein